MNKEFVPYNESLELKQLGFDGIYTFKVYDSTTKELIFSELGNVVSGYILAPLYQQAFRWFREKYDLHRHICYFEDYQVWNGDLYELSTTSLMNFPMELSGYKTYEEAELACLRKLIEIVKSKK